MTRNIITSLALTLLCVTLCYGITCPSTFSYKSAFEVCNDTDYCSDCNLNYTHCLAEDRKGKNETCSICMKTDQLHNEEHHKVRKCFKMPKDSTMKVVMGEERLWGCLQKEGAEGRNVGDMWDELKKEHMVSNVRKSNNEDNITYLFKALHKLGFNCTQPVSECKNKKKLSLDNLEDMKCMNCTCPQGITMEQNSGENTERTNEVDANSSKEDDNTIIAIVTGGVCGVIILIVIIFVVVLQIKKKVKRNKRVTSMELNPEYGVYTDSEYVAEIVNDNEYYATADVYEEDTTQMKDNNIYYE